MQSSAPQLQLDSNDTSAFWPWVLVGISAILMLATAHRAIQSIPRDLLSNAGSVVTAAKAGDINLSMDGRDLNLSGAINISADRDALITQLEGISGIRLVRDNMQVFDPAKKARLDLAAFQSALKNVDFSRVAFERGSASLTQGSRSALFELAQILQAYPEFRVRISGHTDNTGRPEVNLRISRERATSVANFLFDNRIERSRVIAQGYGATKPIADNESPAGRAANRRIEISYVN